MHTIRIGTRGSKLAIAQTREVIKLLTQARPDIALRVHTIATRGDRDQATAVTRLGARGVFVKEIEQALLEGRVDIAVHSAKDLPTAETPGLIVCAFPPRAERRDALVTRGGEKLRELRPGARVGTSSLRRQAQLRALRRDLRFVPLRGNVDTRLRKLAEGQAEALVLAAAGLLRLGREEAIAELLDEEVCLPAAGQGALAVQCRATDDAVREALAEIDDPATRACVEAERAVLAALRCGCAIPVGVAAEVAGEELRLRAVVCQPEGGEIVREELAASAADPQGAGVELARRLLCAGAEEILARLRGEEQR